MGFKIGDKVVVTKNYLSYSLVGLSAEVVTAGVDGLHGLRISGWVGHNLGGLVVEGGWWMPASCFKKAKMFKGNK